METHIVIARWNKAWSLCIGLRKPHNLLQLFDMDQDVVDASRCQARLDFPLRGSEQGKRDHDCSGRVVFACFGFFYLLPPLTVDFSPRTPGRSWILL